MKNYILSFGIVAILLLGSCTKETVTETKTTVPYVAPTPKLIGTWKVIESSNSGNSEEYLIFEAKTNYMHNLTARVEGFKRSYTNVYSADEKVLNWDGWLLNYTVNGDTMTLRESPSEIEYKMVKDNSGAVTAANWTDNLTFAGASVPVINQNNFSWYDYSFGVKGDFLYFSGRRISPTQYRMYEFNTLNGTLTDSINSVNRMAMAYRASNNNLYFGRASGTDEIMKSVGLQGAASNLSTNTISSARSISINPSSGTIYVLNSSRILYAGTDGGNFSELTNLSSMNTYIEDMIYYKNDEFLVVYNSTLHRIKISPSFTVVKSYSRADNFSIYNVSTDGTSIWVYGYDNRLSKNAYRKVTL